MTESCFRSRDQWRASPSRFAVVLLMLASLLAVAAGSGVCEEHEVDDLGNWRCMRWADDRPGHSEPGPSNDGDLGLDETSATSDELDSPPPPPSTTIRRLVTQEDGTTCASYETVSIPAHVTADELAAWYAQQFAVDYENSDAEHVGDCPDQSDDPVPAITTNDVWQVFEGEVERPEPRIRPGRMLTGLTAYLETGRPLTYEDTVVAGPPGNQATLEVRGTATYTVDWGDGTVTGPYETPGEAHPHGTVTHQYTDRGEYTVAVVDTWTLQWRFEGGLWSVAASYDTAPVTLDGFQVQEYRSVRVDSDA